MVVESSDGISSKLGVEGGRSPGEIPCVAVLIRWCVERCAVWHRVIAIIERPFARCEVCITLFLTRSVCASLPCAQNKHMGYLLLAFGSCEVRVCPWDDKGRVRGKRAYKDRLMMVMILILASSARINGRRFGVLRKQPWRFLNTSTWWPWT